VFPRGSIKLNDDAILAKFHMKRGIARPIAATLLLLTLIAAGCGGEKTAMVASNDLVLTARKSASFGAQHAESQDSIRHALRSARKIDSSSALMFHDVSEQISVVVDESFSEIEGRDGATVKFSDASLGRSGDMVPLGHAVPQAEGATLRLGRDAGAIKVEEWWRNSDVGIEQGFTVQSRPDGKGFLLLRQKVTSALRARVVDMGRGVAFFDSNGERLRFEGLVAFDAEGRDLSVNMQLVADSLVFEVDDTNAVFPVVIDPVWSQQAYLKASNSDADDEFGSSVAVSGDTVVVGAPFEDSNALGVNGDGSNNNASGSGAVYVFVRSGTTWSQQAYLKASNAAVGDRFGLSVAVSGDTVVVGAPLEDSNATGVNGDETDNSSTNSGAVYVFVRSGTTWSQQAYLKASNTDIDDGLGMSVAVSGDTVVVGAPFEDSNAVGINGDGSNNSVADAGATYVFTRSGTTWSQQAYLKASNTDPADRFGSSVAGSGDTVAIGAYFEDSNAVGVNGDGSNNNAAGSGAVYVFVRSGTTWSQQAYLKASNTDTGDRFGYSVSVSGDTVAAGAPLEDSNATGVNGDETDNSSSNSGAVYVFVRSSTTWSQQAYLKAPNTDDFDEFGHSVSASADVIAVGAPVESSNATGVNGDQSDNSSLDAGATYVLVRSGTTWSQQVYLKASNSDTDDSLGRVTAVDGDTVVSGAYFEDGSASNVNGIDDNAARDTGAAYVWLMTPTIPIATTTTTAATTTTTSPQVTTTTTAILGDSQTEEQSPNSLPSTGQSSFEVALVGFISIFVGVALLLLYLRRRQLEVG